MEVQQQPPLTTEEKQERRERIFSIERPEKKLISYYTITSILTGPLFLFVFPPLFFRYKTLRYKIDDEGISMRWGILFRREVNLTYSRIQDIHLSSNIIERWLNLARIQIQTASGSAAAEMTIEGLHNFQEIRDFLYSKMRGEKEGQEDAKKAIGGPAAARLDASSVEALTATLQEVAREMRTLREEFTGKSASPASAAPPEEPKEIEDRPPASGHLDTPSPQDSDEEEAEPIEPGQRRPGAPYPETPTQEDRLDT